MAREIENEKQYQNSLKWLVEKAQELEDPLLDGLSRDKLMRTYDFVSDKITAYKKRESEQIKIMQDQAK